MRKDALFQQMTTIFCVQPLTNFVQPRTESNAWRGGFRFASNSSLCGIKLGSNPGGVMEGGGVQYWND